MDELGPVVFYSMLVNMVSRTWAIFLARRISDRTPGEEALASLPTMPTRDLTVVRDSFHGCISVMRERNASRLISVVAFLHVGSLALFIVGFLLIGTVPLVRYISSAH